MNFYLKPVYNRKRIDIVFEEEVCGKLESKVVAIIPYSGCKNSMDFVYQMRQAEDVRKFMEEDKIASRKNLHGIFKALAVRSPWMDVLEAAVPSKTPGKYTLPGEEKLTWRCYGGGGKSK